MGVFNRCLDRVELRPRVALALATFFWAFLGAVAMAQELEAGVSEATSSLKRWFKVGFAAAAIIITMLGLGTAAVKFLRKEPDAVWHLVAAAAGALICGLAAGLM